MATFHYINVRMQNTSKVDEPEVSWDDKIYELIYKKCHWKVTTMS